MIKPDKATMYGQSRKRWQNAEASLTGIMDGHERVSDIDIKDSCALLENLINNKQIEPNYAIDCAAGIGRVSQHALTKFFSNIDLFERDKKFVEYCKENFADNSTIKNIFCAAAEDFQFPRRYDTIWIQWFSPELQDDDLINFLTRCKNALTKNGVIIMKENICDYLFIDADQGNEIRTEKTFEEIFAKCNLSVLQRGRIANWPSDLLPIGVFVLR